MNYAPTGFSGQSNPQPIRKIGTRIFVIVVDDYDWKSIYAHNKAFVSKEAAEAELSRMKESGSYRFCHLGIDEIELIEND